MRFTFYLIKSYLKALSDELLQRQKHEVIIDHEEFMTERYSQSSFRSSHLFPQSQLEEQPVESPDGTLVEPSIKSSVEPSVKPSVESSDEPLVESSDELSVEQSSKSSTSSPPSAHPSAPLISVSQSMRRPVSQSMKPSVKQSMSQLMRQLIRLAKFTKTATHVRCGIG
jgi:hypothetical protein